jgi:uncharacterized protein (TIGR02145 family)
VNSSGTAYGNEVTFTTSGTSGSTGTTQGVPCPGASTVKDIDGNTYNTVQIGTQCWTKENLRVTKYSDGTSIPLDNSGGTSGNGSGETWSKWKTGARTIYAHSQTNLVTYGYLYNWYAAKGIATAGSTSFKNLCPTGWHVPSDAEWTTLSTFLGGVDVAGGKMKTTGTTLWVSQIDGVTNESGFSGIPGGWRGSLGSFNEISKKIYIWSTFENPVWPNNGYLRGLITGNLFYRNWYFKTSGAYIRCLRD